MPNIRVDVGHTIKTGTEVVFRSPVDCSAVTGLKVYYPNKAGKEATMVFAFADAHGNNVGDIPHLFAEDVVVKVILDVDKGMAFVQNADTNAYLEGRFDELSVVSNASGDVISLEDSANRTLRGLHIFGKTEQITTTGKNLLDQHSSDWQSDDTTNGITYSYVRDSDGNLLYINADGENKTTANSHSKRALTTLPVGTYTVSGCPSGYGSAVSIRVGKGASGAYMEVDQGSGYTFTLTKETIISINVMVGAGKAVSNVKFYPMIRLASDTDPTYEPYTGGISTPNPEHPQSLEKLCESVNVTIEGTDVQAQALTVTTPNGLPGIPVDSGGNYTDANDQSWICDEVDFEKGVYVQRVYRQTYIGSSKEAWGKTDATAKDRFYTKYMVSNTMKPCLCNMAVFIPTPAYENGKCFVTFDSSNGNYYFQIIAGDYGTFADPPAWRRYLGEHPMEVLYVLAEEKEIPLSEIDPDALAQYATLHTNYPNTTIFNDAGAEMKVKYVADTKLYIDKKFAELATAMINNV